LGGIGFLRSLGVGFFYPTPEDQLNYFTHRTPKLRFPVEMVRFFFKLLLKHKILAVYHDYH